MDTDVLMKSSQVAMQLKIAFEEEFERTRNWVIKADRLGNWFEKGTELDIAYKVMDAFLYNRPFEQVYAEYKNNPEIKDHDKVKEVIDKYTQWAGHYPKNSEWADFTPFEDNRLLPVKILDKHSAHDERNDITNAVINAMDTAKEEIVFQNPYVILTKRARAAIVRASRRGVKIVIMSNGPTNADHAITQAMFLLDWKDLLRDAPNCEIWALKGPEMLHSKTFVFDKKLSIIGTYNMDPMSEQINSEVVAVINDSDFGAKHHESIMKRRENAVQFTIKINEKNQVVEDFGPDSYADKEALKKFRLWSAARVIRPLI
jgi:phosphatidylserine/phosphatidylglycerophosphate/cardiolipin synthase-like enzyme